MKLRTVFFSLVLGTVTSTAMAVDPIVTDSTSRSTVESTSTIRTPPPSAISPTINASNSDLCTVGVAGAVQTQILGLSAGATVRDMNCERLKLSKTLYDMGMKVAAVSTLCQDKRVFDAMMNAGTPCPYDGMIGDAAKIAWKGQSSDQPKEDNKNEGMSNESKTWWGAGGIGLLFLLFAL